MWQIILSRAAVKDAKKLASAGYKPQVEIIVQDIDNGQRWKSLLGAMPDVGIDEDFSRLSDYGREHTGSYNFIENQSSTPPMIYPQLL